MTLAAALHQQPRALAFMPSPNASTRHSKHQQHFVFLLNTHRSTSDKQHVFEDTSASHLSTDRTDGLGNCWAQTCCSNSPLCLSYAALGTLLDCLRRTQFLAFNAQAKKKKSFLKQASSMTSYLVDSFKPFSSSPVSPPTLRSMQQLL